MIDINSLNGDQKIALLYGIMAGDGCLCEYAGKRGSSCYGLTITGGVDDFLFHKEVVHPLLRHFRGKNTKMRIRKDCRAIEFNFTDKKLFNLMHSYGFPIGKKGQKICVPKIFYDKNLVKYVVQGFMATDGSLVLTKNPNKFYPRVESVVIHKDFLRQVYDYMIFVGLKGAYYLSKSKPNSRWKTSRPKYRFQFNGKDNLLLFEKLIGFINPKHKKKYDDFLEYDGIYDSSIKRIPVDEQRVVREEINSQLMVNMAVLGVEPRTSSS